MARTACDDLGCSLTTHLRRERASLRPDMPENSVFRVKSANLVKRLSSFNWSKTRSSGQLGGGAPPWVNPDWADASFLSHQLVLCDQSRVRAGIGSGMIDEC